MLDFFKAIRRLADRDQAGLYLSNETIEDLVEETGRMSDKVIAFFKRFAWAYKLHFKQDTMGIHLCRYKEDLP